MSTIGNAFAPVRDAFDSIGDAFHRMNQWQKYSFYAIVIIALYLAPFWTDIPVIGPIVDTPGTQFSTVLNDQVIIFVLVALGLNVVVGLAGLLDLGYVGFYAVGE